ncbi:MAG: hypothetical protein NTY19_24665 [Planctomycetota bacterium]|nr:hypothetical protein [Planctomycetota bacterium]
MSQAISAHFDGRVIIPDVPLEFPPGQRLSVRIEQAEPDPYPLAQIAELATDMLVEDLAERHSEYARRGAPDSPHD